MGGSGAGVGVEEAEICLSLEVGGRETGRGQAAIFDGWQELFG